MVRRLSRMVKRGKSCEDPESSPTRTLSVAIPDLGFPSRWLISSDYSSVNRLVSVREVVRLPADKFGKQLRVILNAIDNLHQVPTIKPIDVKVGRDRDRLGGYIKHSGTGRPLGIEVSRRQNDPMELAFAHEIGHLIEGAMIPDAPFGVRNWVNDKMTRDWRRAVRTTAAFQKLQQITQTGRISIHQAAGIFTDRAANPTYL